MIGVKIYKNSKSDMANYTKTAVWCNSNNAHIIDMGEYYEVVENVPYMPSKEEQIAQLDSQYQADKATLMQYYFEFSINDNTAGMESIKQELADLAESYDEALIELESD